MSFSGALAGEETAGAAVCPPTVHSLVLPCCLDLDFIQSSKHAMSKILSTLHLPATVEVMGLRCGR